MAYPISRHTFFPLLRTFFGEINGLENLPKNGPYIIAANHVGNIDYFFIAAAIILFTKRKIHFIARREAWRDFLGDFIVKKWWGCIVIDPQNTEKCLEETENYLKRGRICAIFPEGGPSKHSKELFKGKTGLAKLALKTGIPVIPVGFWGPIGGPRRLIDFFKNLHDFYGKVYIQIGQPMTFLQIKNLEINKELLEQITREIMLEVAKLSGQIYPY